MDKTLPVPVEVQNELHHELHCGTKTENEVAKAQTIDRIEAPVLSAGEWARQVLGFEAPFGHDGMPTVWG